MARTSGRAKKLATKQQAADFLGISTRTLDNWRNEGCPGIMPGGDCDLAMITKWRIQQESAAIADQFAEAGVKILTKDQLEVAIMQEKLITEQIRNEKEAGRLIPIEDALLEFTRQISDMRIAGETGIFKYAPLMVGLQSQEEAENSLRSYKDEMFAALVAGEVVNPRARDDSDDELIGEDDAADEEGLYE